MNEYLNSLSTWEFALLLVVAFLAALQLTLFVRHALAGSAASFVPGILAIVGAVVLFAVR